jgi:hypothetical protein
MSALDSAAPRPELADVRASTRGVGTTRGRPESAIGSPRRDSSPHPLSAALAMSGVRIATDMDGWVCGSIEAHSCA